MKTFKIPCSWSMDGYYIVDAETKEEAIEKTYILPLSEVHNAEYIENSHEPDEELTTEIL